MKKILGLLVALALLTLMIPLGALAEEDDVFKVYAFLQMTGSNALSGIESSASCEVAKKIINENGGFNGQELVIEYFDTQGSPEEAVKLANQFIEAEDCDVIIGSVNSNECLAALPYVNDAEILSFGLGTAASWMDLGMEYVYRCTMNNALAAPLTVSIAQDMGYSKVGILCSQDEASVSTAEVFIGLCEESGIEVTAFEKYDTGDVDYSAQIAKIIASEPDVVYVCLGGYETGSAIKQTREGGWDGMILLKESYQSFSYEISGPENSKYLAFANPYVNYSSVEQCPDSLPVMKQYLADYQELHGSLPTSGLRLSWL